MKGWDRKGTRESFKVSVTLPAGASVRETKHMILRAVLSEPGHLNPDDPLFNLNRSTVVVTHINQVKEPKK